MRNKSAAANREFRSGSLRHEPCARPVALMRCHCCLWIFGSRQGRQAGSVVVVGRAGYYEMTMMTTRPETLLPPLLLNVSFLESPPPPPPRFPRLAADLQSTESCGPVQSVIELKESEGAREKYPSDLIRILRFFLARRHFCLRRFD